MTPIIDNDSVKGKSILPSVIKPTYNTPLMMGWSFGSEYHDYQ